MDKSIVQKALSPEEMTGLSNIVAICQEILQSGKAAEQTPAPVPEQKATMSQYDNPDEEKKKPEETSKEAKKAIETTPPDATDAGTPPETQEKEIETEETKRAVDEVAKMLLTALRPQKVQKAKDPVLSALENIALVVKQQSERQDLLATSFGQVLDGLGVMKQLDVAKAAQQKKETEYKPVQTIDTQKFIEGIAKALGSTPAKQENKVEKSQSEKVLDETGDILLSIFGPNRLTK
jgi:hypothetical protein